jgi:hypothetical protein
MNILQSSPQVWLRVFFTDYPDLPAHEIALKVYGEQARKELEWEV